MTWAGERPVSGEMFIVRKMAVAVLTVTVLAVPVLGGPSVPRSFGSAAVSATTGVPAAAPAAAHRPEPVLPKPAGWPFGEAFPRTSGTGRVAAGATYWSDFLYDDHGAKGTQTSFGPVGLAPSVGTYLYADANAH